MRAWWSVMRVINYSDIVVHVVDARFPETISKKIERLVKLKRKKFLVLFNKIDLVKGPKSTDKSYIEFSCKDRTGRTKLLEELIRLGGGRVGIVGFPNTGKSSVINTLVGRKIAKTSPVAGFTKGPQYIRLNEGILLIDTPGIIPVRMEKEDLVLIDALKVESGDPLLSFNRLLPRVKHALEQEYGTIPTQEPLAFLARKLHMIKKGAEPDLYRAALFFLRRWQKGELF